jgi:copper chaperone CopZ
MPPMIFGKFQLPYLSVLFFVIVQSSLANAQDSAPKPQLSVEQTKINNSEHLKKLIVRISGSMCTACLKRLQEKLAQLDGVSDIDITARPMNAKPFRRKDEIHPRHKQAVIRLTFQSDRIGSREIAASIKQSDFDILSISSRRDKNAVYNPLQ